MKLIALYVCLSVASLAETPPKLWWASVVAEAAASSADAYTSIGNHELNPLLRGPGGIFSPPKGAAYKSGLFAAAVIPQYFALRKRPRLAKFFEMANFGHAAVYGALAIHNSRMHNKK